MKSVLIRSIMIFRIFMLLLLFADELAQAQAGPVRQLDLRAPLAAATLTRAAAPGHHLPDAALLTKQRNVRRQVSAKQAIPDRPLPEFIDRDYTAEASHGGDGRECELAPEMKAELARLTDLLHQREAEGAAGGIVRGSDREAPWSESHLLADATHMADQYVSLQRSPAGHLYAVWQANDLGGSDRDIHIAVSLSNGMTWQVYEMPSYDQDEYHAELAIDAAGYLFVTWIRADGVILRSRSMTSESVQSWAWVKGLSSGETHATPCIAVSGSGNYARVFICAAWNTINYNLMTYEWTLIWMYSTNGGDTVNHDYFDPDGYPDYWPDAEMNNSTVYLLNAEKDYQTGVLEVVAADGPLGGIFNEPWYLTSWTDFNCQFPSLTAQGDNVFAVFQMEYDDGIGNTDGDIVFCYSDDGLASMYGPYEMACDDYDSVGPVLYSHDGVVGCLWLDAAPGDDEFMLCARQAGGSGHPDAWGEIETILEDRYVDPMFRTAAGTFGYNKLHAAWSDRRDYPTQNMNIYTSERPVLPNLTACVPAGWDSSLVLNLVAGERSNGLLAADETAYLSCAFTNSGMQDIAADFQLRLLVDGEPYATWELSGGLGTGYYSAVEDYPLTLPAGIHLIEFELDFTDLIDEDDETDNTASDNFNFIDGDPRLLLAPTQLTHVFDDGQARGAQPVTPLINRVSVPVISERLAEAMFDAGDGEKLRVLVEPRRQVDALALRTRLAGLSRDGRGERTASALRSTMRENRVLLDPQLRALIERGEALEPVELWFSGQLLVEMSSVAVRELAENPEVGLLWLDDLKSEFFTEPSETETAGGRALAWHLNKIGAPAAWAQGYDGTGILIGHLDSGVAWDHPDLTAGLWDGGSSYPHHGWDCLDEDNDPYDGDTDYHHGTHTAGCIIGTGALGTTSGAAPGARLIALRCVPGYFADFVEGLQFCLDHGTQVINASAGWSNPPAELSEANRDNANILAAAGIAWVCAAGNGDNMGGHNPAPNDIATPGDVPNPFYGAHGHSAVISVGASTSSDQMNVLSSIGPTSWEITTTPGFDDYPYPPGLMKPDLVAPGQSITSTTPGGYATYDGSSMATPLVSAACAILLQACPGLPLADLAETLENSVVDIMAAGRDNNSGAGRLDIPVALAQLPDGAWESFAITNTGQLPLAVTDFAGLEPWLLISPAEAVIMPGETLGFIAIFDPDLLPAGLSRADVIVHSNDPLGPHDLTVFAIVGTLTGLPEIEQQASRPSMLTAWPNPFNPKTVIRFTNPAWGRVRLSVHGADGRLLRVLVDEDLPAGAGEFAWDGRAASGRALASGVYFARVDIGGKTMSRKLVLLK
ncbi:MAG: S8 family serine peptidase [bacterium]|nr:S8 family serine peptidase [bacterium]